MSRQPRFEIVRTDAGWHARFIAKNGRIVWTTEVYTRRGKAVNAISIVSVPSIEDPSRRWVNYALIEVRDVDERGTA